MAEPRWWWAFEGSRYQSPASIAATVPSIADRVELGHGGLGEVAAVRDFPLVVDVGGDGSGETDHGGLVGKMPTTRARRLISC
jgi:hypothetical protein